MSLPTVRQLEVRRTARYFLRGPEHDPSEVWFLLHGYAQLADEFLGEFDALDDGRRLLVAPEGLSRFYRRGTDGEVAASWMTRIEREDEVRDYVAYLDALPGALGLDAATPVHLLGFSQGAATAARWAVHGAVRARRLILWGSGVAPDVLAEAERLSALELTLVLGREDRYATEERVAVELARLDAAGIRYRPLRFDGGHELHAATLRRLVEEA